MSQGPWKDAGGSRASCRPHLIQLGQCSLWEGDIGTPGPVLTLQLRGFPQPMPLPRSATVAIHPFSQP